MSNEVTVAIITTIGAIMVAGLGVLGSWVRDVRGTARQARDAAAATEHQVHPNSGRSLRDAVDRIDERIVSLLRRQDRNEKRLDDHLVQAAQESDVIAGLVRHLATHDHGPDADQTGDG